MLLETDSPYFPPYRGKGRLKDIPLATVLEENLKYAREIYKVDFIKNNRVVVTKAKTVI